MRDPDVRHADALLDRPHADALLDRTRADDLLDRARAVIPHGVFGHRRTFAFVDGQARPIPEDYPHFVRDAFGCRFTDASGRTYIDYLCGYGPMISGYRRAEVDAAFAAQQARGLAYSFPAEIEVELAERLCARIPGAALAAFSLSGTDAIGVALAIARAHTGRGPILVARGAWHGNHTNLAQGAGRLDAERPLTRTLPWGDEGALERALAAEPVAAVLLCPYDQQVGADNRLPPPGLWPAIRRLCDRHGALLVIDDVRSGLRLDPRGSAAHFGIDADLLCISKALANGYPVAATLARPHLRRAAEAVFVSGTFWGFAPALAAALQNLDLIDDAACAHLAAMGARLTDGLSTIAAARGLELVVTGPAALPLVRFADDPDHARACALAHALARRGVLVHPTHNWFLSLAHQPADIDATLDRAEAALAEILA